MSIAGAHRRRWPASCSPMRPSSSPRLHVLAALGRTDVHGDPRRRSARLHGAIIGALAFVLLEEWLADLTEHWKLIFGPLLVLAVLFLRGGLVGLPAQLRGGCAVAEPLPAPRRPAQALRRPGRHRRRHARRRARRDPRRHRPERRRQDHADPPDQRHAARPMPGSIAVRRRATSPRLPLHAARAARAWRAPSRSPRILPGFSALENVALAVQARSGSSFRFFRPAAREARAERRRRWRRWTEVGLADARRTCRPARSSHGEKRAARTRHRAGHAAAPAAARRADGRRRAARRPSAWSRCCAA